MQKLDIRFYFQKFKHIEVQTRNVCKYVLSNNWLLFWEKRNKMHIKIMRCRCMKAIFIWVVCAALLMGMYAHVQDVAAVKWRYDAETDRYYLLIDDEWVEMPEGWEPGDEIPFLPVTEV
jgi:hypothetical protein